MLKKRASAALASGFVLLLSLEVASAPAVAADLVTLYGEAQLSDPVFQSARHSLEAARQKSPEALSALLPALSATGAEGRTVGRTRYTDTPEIRRGFDTDQWALQLSQPVFRADKVFAYSEARQAVQQAVAQFEAAREDLMLRFSRAYFDVIVAEKRVIAARTQVVAFNEQLQAAQHSFDGGVASITDVDDTRSRAAGARAQEVGALNDLESARAALEAIIGVPPEKLAALREGVALPRPVPGDVSSWIDQARADNPNVRAAEAVAKAADYDLDRSRSQHLPAVDLVVSYGGNYSGGNITEPINYDTVVRDKQISLQVTVPLLDGGGMHAQIAEARAQRAKALADLTTAQRQAVLDARQSFAAALSGAAQVEALETAVSSGQRAVKGNQVGYSLGIRINSDVLNAEQQLHSAMQDLDKARYDTLYAGLKLKAATGQLSEDDLRGINALLETSL